MTAIVIPDAFTLRAKFTASNHVWYNSIDITPQTSGSTPTATSDAVVSFINWLPPNTSDSTTIVDVSCFKKRAGKGQLNIADTIPLFVVSLNEPGNRNTAYGQPAQTETLDYQAVCYCKRVCAGRPGKMFIRALLREGDVIANDGDVWTFEGGTGTVNPTTFAAQVAAHLTASFAGGGATWKYAVVHVREDALGNVIESNITQESDLVLEYPGWFRRKR